MIAAGQRPQRIRSLGGVPGQQPAPFCLALGFPLVGCAGRRLSLNGCSEVSEDRAMAVRQGGQRAGGGPGHGAWPQHALRSPVSSKSLHLAEPRRVPTKSWDHRDPGISVQMTAVGRETLPTGIRRPRPSLLLPRLGRLVSPRVSGRTASGADRLSRLTGFSTASRHEGRVRLYLTEEGGS